MLSSFSTTLLLLVLCVKFSTESFLGFATSDEISSESQWYYLSDKAPGVRENSN